MFSLPTVIIFLLVLCIIGGIWFVKSKNKKTKTFTKEEEKKK